MPADEPPQLLFQLKAPQVALHRLGTLLVLSVFGQDAPLTVREALLLVSALQRAIREAERQIEHDAERAAALRRD